MKKIACLSVFIVVIAFIGITITGAFAASPPTLSIEERFANQQKRINEGSKSGAITRDEAKILLENLNYAQQEQKRLAEDGKLTEEEKTRLHKMLDQNSKMIEDKKNNPVTAMVPQIPQRIGNQQKRIDERVKSGALTGNDAKVLKDNLKRINTEEKRLAKDGTLTEAEKARLHSLLDQNSKMIEDKKGNPVTENAPYLEWRFANQQKRINEGIQSGALTRDEAKILLDNISHAQKEQKRLARDGKLTEEERTRLHNMLDQNSKMIDDKKSNPVTSTAPQVHQRIANQQKRINEGIKSGKLTQNESKTLLDNLNYIQQEEKRLTAAGKFTEADKDRLNKILDQNSEMIEDLKSNPAKKLY